VSGGETFLVVATLQKGEAPKVEVERPGPAPAVRVGRQTILFDGERIVLGK